MDRKRIITHGAGKMKLRLLCVIVMVQIFLPFASVAETIHLSVAASMTDAFKELISGYSTTSSTAKTLPNFASSGSLAKQVEQGAPADLYVSANPKWMRYLLEKKMIEKGTDYIFAYNTLVFVGDKETAARSLEDLPGLQRVALGNPMNVPAGQYARQALEKAGIYRNLKNNKKLIFAKDVRQALLYAERGEVDGAFVYKTDALLATNTNILFTVPQKLYDRVSYPVALTVTGAKKKQARDFYQYVKSGRADVILRKYGFEPPRR